MRFKFVGYSPVSKSLADLSQATDIKRLYRPPTIKVRPQDIVFNWGCGSRGAQRFYYDIPHESLRYTNNFESVNAAVDKRLTFRAFASSNVPTVPEVTFNIAVALEWLRAGKTVVARRTSISRGGYGIDVIPPTPEAIDALSNTHHGKYELFTVYFKKKREYRVHVWHKYIPIHQAGFYSMASYSPFYIQEKRLKTDTTPNPLTFAVRSKNQGWVFCTENVSPPDCVVEAAILAVRSLRLWFGAVDVGYNEHYNRAAVFEVNTAPGLEGTTLDLYANQFKKLKEEIKNGSPV